ncbi:MAG: tetratricopeptide repeat protein [Bacteroidota bacterium]|nr:tetratricopeptide repeat protein [Bacteroidota bacterium]
MRKTSFLYFASFTLAVLILSSCGGIKKMAKNQELMEFSVQPKILEMHADQVEVNISGSFPAKFFAKKAIVTITPVLVWEGGEKAFKSVTLQGEGAEANNKAISFEKGGEISYTDIIPYQADMNKSELFFRIKAEQGSKSIDLLDKKEADGVIATPALLQADAKSIEGSTKRINVTPPAYDPSQSVFQQKVMERLNADIHYKIQRSNIGWNEKKSDDINALKDYLGEVKENERLELKDIDISSYASPDGEYNLNEKLSGNRGLAASKFLNKELKRKKIEGTKLNEKTTAEDWSGFKEVVQASELTDKDLILRVLSMYSDPVVRETQIKNMAAAYKLLADDILPQLRRSKMQVNVEKIGWYDEELKKLVETNPDTLNQAELLYAATLTEDANKKLEIYNFFSNKYKNDWRGLNNAGIIYIEQNKLDDAKQSFENAKKRDDNAIVLNNLGVCEILNGNFVDAENYFAAALSAGKKASYNLGICEVKKGNYSEAVSKMGSCTSFNAALAQLLKGDNNAALKTLEANKEKDAMVYYLKAVVGARTSNDELVFSSLKTAINKDGTLAGKAKNDLEFFKYFEMGNFKTLVE